MNPSQRIFILDTNVIIDYIEILPNGDDTYPEGATVDLRNAHLVVPAVVVDELDKFKKEPHSARGEAAREASRRLRKLSEKRDDKLLREQKLIWRQAMTEIYILSQEAAIEVRGGSQLFSKLPVDPSSLPELKFKPAAGDIDGQIILTAIAAQVNDVAAEVTILTNDNNLASRASDCGIRTSRYGHKLPEPYTGRRYVIVPNDLFLHFISSGSPNLGEDLTLEEWQEFMPKEPPLIANEFIFMKPAEPDKLNINLEDVDRDYSHIGRYDKRRQTIVPLRHLREYGDIITPQNAGQACCIDAILEPASEISTVIIAGPAGTGKTFIATTLGLQLVKEGVYSDLAVIPCDVEDNIGYLPGGLDEKMDLLVGPIKNALRNFFLKQDRKGRRIKNRPKQNTENSENQDNENESVKNRSIKTRLTDKINLAWKNWFRNIPVAHARGLDFLNEFVIYDEFQDFNRKQATTLILRLGEDSKMVIAGSYEQIHAPYLDPNNNGLTYAQRLMYDEELVAYICLTEEEVRRSAFVSMIVNKLKKGYVN